MGEFWGAAGAFVFAVAANVASDLLHDLIAALWERRRRRKHVGKHMRR